MKYETGQFVYNKVTKRLMADRSDLHQPTWFSWCPNNQPTIEVESSHTGAVKVFKLAGIKWKDDKILEWHFHSIECPIELIITNM